MVEKYIFNSIEEEIFKELKFKIISKYYKEVIDIESIASQ
jgi:hypothetical protein